MNREREGETVVAYLVIIDGYSVGEYPSRDAAIAVAEEYPDDDNATVMRIYSVPMKGD